MPVILQTGSQFGQYNLHETHKFAYKLSWTDPHLRVSSGAFFQHSISVARTWVCVDYMDNTC